jgi:hypothetical protein
MSCEARYRMPPFRQKQRKLSVIDSSLAGNYRACACRVISGESLPHLVRGYEIQVQCCTLLQYIVQNCTVCLRMRDGDHVIYLVYLERGLTHESRSSGRNKPSNVLC